MKGKYADFAEKNLHVTLRSGSEWMVRCPFHDNTGSASAQFNIDKGLIVCFSCGEGGGMKKLSRHLGIRFQEPLFDVNDLIGKLNRLRNSNGQDVQLTVLPEETLGRYDFPTDYWHKRGFTDETIDLFQLGYDPLEDTAIIPVRNFAGGLVGVIRRFLDPDAELRYRYPKGFKRSSNMFASWLWEHEETDTLVLTEGAVDSMMVWQAGFMSGAQYGSSISPEQIRLLKRAGIGRVVLFHDNDKAGKKATAQALGVRVHMRNGKRVEEYDPRCDLSRSFLIETVRYPRRLRANDPGAMSEDDIRKLVAHARPLI